MSTALCVQCVDGIGELTEYRRCWRRSAGLKLAGDCSRTLRLEHGKPTAPAQNATFRLPVVNSMNHYPTNRPLVYFVI